MTDRKPRVAAFIEALRPAASPAARHIPNPRFCPVAYAAALEVLG